MKTTRKISLTRLHVINWYGYADSIPVTGNLLLAGITGSGKSILMDMLQFVLVGDRRLVKFNQSATGAASARDLKGYVLGDIKEDEDGVAQYMRDSVIAYAALEFTWPANPGETTPKVETWGLRVEYTSAAEQQGRISPWWCEGGLERGDFLTTTSDSKRVPRELPDWRRFVTDRGGEVFVGIEEYRRDMSAPGHLNFDHGILSRLLPTAMSFTFLKSFNEFCRLFILPADRLNVSDVTASYRTFQRYEEELAELRKQLQALEEVHRLYEEHESLTRDAALSRYLAAELNWKYLEGMRTEANRQLEELKTAAQIEEQRLNALDQAIPHRREEINQVKDLIRQNPGGDTYLFIKSENKQLVAQIGELKGIGNSLESALSSRVQAAKSWIAKIQQLPFELNVESVEAVERAIERVAVGGVAKADDTMHALGEAAKKAAIDVSRVARPTAERLGKVRLELGALREEVAALKLGRLPFPTKVLDTLNNGLIGFASEPPARHLAQLCEVKDERWRAAIEVAFTRKFAIVVAEAHYDEAARIYHEMRAEALGRDVGRESLINPAKALKLPGKAKLGSLAEKVETQHPVAAAIIAHLFGRLMCCETREDLSHHEFAILADGFMQRGAFLERVRHYDNLPFIGERGLRQQQIWKENEIAKREAEERRIMPVQQMVDEVQRVWHDQFENAVPLDKQLAQVSELPRLEAKRDANIERLNLMDRAKFDEWEQKGSELENELKGWEEEQRKLLTNQKHKDVQRASEASRKSAEEAAQAKSSFDTVSGEQDFSQWLTRLDELRQDMMQEYPALDIAARRFHERQSRCKNEADVMWERLIGARRLFVERFPRFDDLSVEAGDNVAYDRMLSKINDADIPAYELKAKDERQKWEHLFREQVLEKLRAALIDVKNIIVLLNASLNKPIGTSRYFIEHRKNPDFEIYHRMLDATAAAGSDLFASIADQQLRDEVGRFLNLLVEAPDGIEAAKLLDYRHYFQYDMLVEDISLPSEQRRRISVDRQSGKFSGGENQSPYFIAILASYLRAYRRHERYRNLPTLALVPIDEAFSKLSGERIADCIDALQQLELQGIFSMSTGNIPYAFEKCDHLLVVSKEERRVGRKLKVRNIAVSIARESEEAREIMCDVA